MSVPLPPATVAAVSATVAGSAAAASSSAAAPSTAAAAPAHKRLNASQAEEQERKKRRLLAEIKSGAAVSFKTSRDEGFAELMQQSYRGFVAYPAAKMTEDLACATAAESELKQCVAAAAAASPPSEGGAAASSSSSSPDVHSAIRSHCFLPLLHSGMFLRDVIQVGGNDSGGVAAGAAGAAGAARPAKGLHYVRTRVQRVLVGEEGVTYRYSGVRLFAHPWSMTKSTATAAAMADEEESKQCADASCAASPAPPSVSPVARAFNMLRALNTHMRATTTRALVATYSLASDPAGARNEGGAHFNAVLLNYLDPSTHRIPLRGEPYYAMGPLAIGWHRDESLVERSSIAVYHSSEAEGDSSLREQETEDDSWCIALKVAWDISTPAVRVPLASGDGYLMAFDLNSSHQHAVLAGKGRRFSATHRVVLTDTSTLGYIESRVQAVRASWEAVDTPRQVSLPAVELLCSVADELEFEWVRQFWIQGTRHARNHAGYWRPHIDRLEREWTWMQARIAWLYSQLANYGFSAPAAPLDSVASTAPPSPALDLPLCSLLLRALQSTQALRLQWTSRYRQSAYHPAPHQRDDSFVSGESQQSEDGAHEDEPIVRPEFGADASSMPLDLSECLQQLGEWETEFQQLANSK